MIKLLVDQYDDTHNIALKWKDFFRGCVLALVMCSKAVVKPHIPACYENLQLTWCAGTCSNSKSHRLLTKDLQFCKITSKTLH